MGHVMRMSFHERAVKADREARAATSARLPKKYPYIDMSRFKILTHIDNDALARGSAHEVDYPVAGDDKARFWDNKQFTKHLYSNRPFPPLWSGGGSIQALPKGKRHGSGADTWYNSFPAAAVLNYPLENFRVYVDGTKYFMSRLPPLQVSRPDLEKWSDSSTYYRSLLVKHIVRPTAAVFLRST